MKIPKLEYFSKWDAVPFSSYVGFFLAFVVTGYQFKVAFVATILAFIITYF
jgi:hypothetical protein